MKKIYFILSLAVIALLSSCSEDYNEHNFPGYTDAATPTNVVSYVYTFTNSDYTTIGNTIKKPIEDKITIQNNLVKAKEKELKDATTATDSARIKTELTALKTLVNDSISRLKLDSLYTTGVSIVNNRVFKDSTQFIANIPLILNTKYPYVDDKSTAEISFNLSFDTTKISAANKYTFVTIDYDAMGTTASLPGENDYFTSAISPDYYIPLYLSKNYPYASSGDLKLIRYKYYLAKGNIPLTATVYKYDGSKWVNYNSTAQTQAKFTYKNNAWTFVKSEVFIEKFVKDIGYFTQQQVVGSYLWYWGTYNGGCMQANAYGKGSCESWLISPIIDLKDRTNPTLSFEHVINYYNTSLILTDLASVYVSTDYTNDVTKATWTKMSITYPTNLNTFATGLPWTNSGKINLTAYANKKITFAFKYVSAGTAIAWEVSKINVLDE
jgi:hypothetical protein